MKPLSDTPKSADKTDEKFKPEHLHRHVSIWLDSYDDIFSDFDPRGYAERNISDDFLVELKKVSHESDFHISELKLLAPEKTRNAETELIIANRLHSQFIKSYNHYKKEQKADAKQGWFLTISGMTIMICAGYISYINYEGFIKHILFVMLEPAGWFMVWAGFDFLFFLTRKRKPEMDFYNKLGRSKVVFANLEKL